MLRDPFLRFWFRFVFPYQADLDAGLAPEDLYDAEVDPALAGHIAATFEDVCRAYTRRTYGKTASQVGCWWGNAVDALRRSRHRSSEEIDIVGVARGRVTLVGEAKWTTSPMRRGILRDLEQYKLPALRQAGFKLASDIRTVLYCRAGFTESLRAVAADNDQLHLIDGAEVLQSGHAE